VSIRVRSEPADKFEDLALSALSLKAGLQPGRMASEDLAQRLARAPLAHFARVCLSHAGRPMDEFAPDELILEAAFEMDGPGKIRADASTYNRPGSFPNLLSGLANKILDEALDTSEPTYEAWTGELTDLPDFKPAPVVARSDADELDEILDGAATQDLELSEEMLSYMIVRRFSNKIGLTPALAANDDLGAFRENLLGLENAWQNTVNRGCLYLLTGNVQLLDGFALFDNTNHGNDVTTGGGAPSVTQWQAMDLKVAAQRGIGGRGYVRAPLGVCLVPPAHHAAALQTFAAFQSLAGGEVKTPTADGNINVYRGTVTVVREPELQTVSSAVWYGLCKPRGSINATIARAYFKGWGKNGRRQRWYDPARKTLHFELEGRVGMAAKQYRTAVRNSGTA
jgi:hypothetical protein